MVLWHEVKMGRDIVLGLLFAQEFAFEENESPVGDGLLQKGQGRI